MRDFDLSKNLVTLVYPLIQSLYLKIMSRDRYANYTELSRNETENRDYRRVIVRNTLSNVAVIAPHGGLIEPGASEIARAIAGENFNLYLFEGIKPRRNFKDLHITSQHFDEPKCLGLLAECEIVIAIHGYTAAWFIPRTPRTACTSFLASLLRRRTPDISSCTPRPLEPRLQILLLSSAWYL